MTNSRQEGPTRSRGALGRRTVLTGAAALGAAPLLGGLDVPADPAPRPFHGAGGGPWQVRAYGSSTQGPFQPIEIPRRELRAEDVLIDVMYCAVCHSDIHIARQEWPPPYPATQFPCVPGHEIVGCVAAVGRRVKRFRVGDAVGTGPMIDSCRTCENCRAGLEQYCLEGWTLNFNTPDPYLGGHHYGGFSERVVVPERFAVSIPKGMDLASAAPLLCAGITTFSPIQHWDLGKGQRLGIIGFGGLGHLALKLGVDRKAKTTVFTTTPDKVADTERMGAHEAVVWSDAADFEPYTNRFDLLISTVPGPVPTNPLVQTLRLDGSLVIVGAREPVQDLSGSALWGQRRSVSASLMGGMGETQDFVAHCARRGIAAEIELIRPDQIHRAFDQVKQKSARYRYVVDLTQDRHQPLSS